MERELRVEGIRETGAKFTRAQPVAGQAANGNIRLLRGPWVEAFLDEMDAFSEEPRSYSHDDQVDALAGAYGYLAGIALFRGELGQAFAFGAPRDGSGLTAATRDGRLGAR